MMRLPAVSQEHFLDVAVDERDQAGRGGFVVVGDGGGVVRGLGHDQRGGGAVFEGLGGAEQADDLDHGRALVAHGVEALVRRGD